MYNKRIRWVDYDNVSKLTRLLFLLGVKYEINLKFSKPGRIGVINVIAFRTDSIKKVKIVEKYVEMLAEKEEGVYGWGDNRLRIENDS